MSRFLVFAATLLWTLAATAQSFTSAPGGSSTCGQLTTTRQACYYTFTTATDPNILQIHPTCSVSAQLTGGGATVDLYSCTDGGAFTAAKCNARLWATDVNGVNQTSLDGATTGKVKFAGLTGPFLGVDVTGAPAVSATLVVGCNP